MSVEVIEGNIFTSKCQTLVNTINCVGVMGAGIALECRLRYPEMYTKYVDLCNKHQISIGLLWIYKSQEKWILNFPTKKDWKHPSKEKYLNAGLEKFISTYESRKIKSIAFPLLGADKGGIDQERSLEIMLSHLEKLPIDIEIYRYRKTAKDDIYENTRDWLLSQDIESITTTTKLKKIYVERVVNAMQGDEIYQLNQLAQIKGIGIKTLEKLFKVSQEGLHHKSENQQKLF